MSGTFIINKNTPDVAVWLQLGLFTTYVLQILCSTYRIIIILLSLFAGVGAIRMCFVCVCKFFGGPTYCIYIASKYVVT